MELQNNLEKNLPVSDHLKWIEYLINQDTKKNRIIPLLAIRNFYEPTNKKEINPWLLEVHKSYKYLPKIENCRPEIDEKVLILNKNGKFSVPKKVH